MIALFEIKAKRTRETIWAETEARALQLAKLLEAENEHVSIRRLDATLQRAAEVVYESK